MTTNTQIENLVLEEIRLEEIPSERTSKIPNKNPKKIFGEEYYLQQKHSPCGIPRKRYNLNDENNEIRRCELLKFIQGSKYRTIYK